jgi:hypothetical protein
MLDERRPPTYSFRTPQPGANRPRITSSVERLTSAEEDPGHGVLTAVARAFTVRSAAFPVENLLEPDTGAVGRTSAANPFEYVLRCCRPKQVAPIDLRSSVERTSLILAARERHRQGTGVEIA